MGDKIISVYWFAILLIIAGAVVYMTFLFYGNPYDVRETELNILSNQIADCLAVGGKLKTEVVSGLSNNNFLQICNLNLNVEENYGWKEQEQYYIEIPSLGISIGNINLNSECNLRGSYPLCLEKFFYASDVEGNVQKIIIKTSIRKIEKNVKQ